MNNFKRCNPHPQGLLVRDCVKRACVIASEINYHDIAIMLNRFRTTSGGLWSINGAFTPISNYRILVNEDELRWVYSWSLDWHVQNLSGRVEEIETQDYKKALKQLKKKYATMVKHNTYFAFDIVEYRGDDFNRIILNDNVGLEPYNFDEKIRKEIFKK